MTIHNRFLHHLRNHDNEQAYKIAVDEVLEQYEYSHLYETKRQEIASLYAYIKNYKVMYRDSRFVMVYVCENGKYLLHDINGEQLWSTEMGVLDDEIKKRTANGQLSIFDL